MSNEILKAIKQKIQDRVARKELYSSFIDPEEIKSFNDCVSSIKRGRISLEELSLLKDIYEVLNSMLTNIASNRDNNKGSLNDQNLESILKIVKIIEEKAKAELEEKAKAELEEKAKAELEKKAKAELEEKAKAELEEKAKAELEKKAKAELEKKAKAELEKKAKAELEKKAKAELEKKAKAELEKKAKAELEKKAKAEFGKYIKNGTIDAVSIEKRKDQNSLYATIKLKDDNKNTDIRVSEFLNSEFCKENNIAGFLLSSGDQKEPISGYINEGVRYYNLGTAAQYGIKFNWYVGERECSITLSASDGSIKIVSNKPDDKDLEKNKDVKIKVGGDYLSLAEAVKTCKQNSQQSNDTSSKLSQPSATEHFRSVAYN